MKEEKELIVVKQLPIIEEQLKTLSKQIDEKVEVAMKLPVNEETVTEVKKVRADLNKDFKSLEEKRKFVKEEIMKPYLAFEKIYKLNVSDKFDNADKNLKEKITIVENSVKQIALDLQKEYFTEYATSLNIDFVNYENTNFPITLGMLTSKKELVKKAKDVVVEYLDKINDDLKLIDTQDHKEEILVEYKTDFNVSKAITTVTDRFKKIEEEKIKQEELAKLKEVEAKVVAKVEENTNYVRAPRVEEVKKFKMTFTVKGTKEELVELKNYLIEKGMLDNE